MRVLPLEPAATTDTLVFPARAARPHTPAERLAYSLSKASRVSGLSVATLCTLEKAGRLRFYKVGGRTMVAAGSLHALLTGEAA